MKRTTLLIILMGVSLILFSQVLVFGPPEKLEPEINTSGEEIGPMLSHDGKTLYFSRAFYESNQGGALAGSDIWKAEKDSSGNWQQAVNVGRPWNNNRANAIIGINQDHTVVYLLNAYTNRSGISFSKLKSDSWDSPEFISIPDLQRDDFVGFYIVPTFDVVFISMKGKDTKGKEDLYISLKNSVGDWSTPRNLGPAINTTGFEISPFLSADKKRLYFASNGHQGSGDADIFYSDRLFDSWETWSVPKSVGQMVNSSGFEAYLTIQNEKYYFSRNGDIYYGNLATKVRENLGEDRQYLTEAEVKQKFGSAFETSLLFNCANTELSRSHNGALRKIADAVKQQPALRVHLMGDRSDDRSSFELYQKRLLNILEWLRNSGIDGGRITLGTSDEMSIGDCKIYIKFY